MSVRQSNHLRSLGSTGLKCYPLGFGCYRIMEGNAQHEAALRSYLDRGGNLIDTSANYGDGRSEVLIGRVLQDYDRDRVIVVTKGGYIQGQNMTLARRREFPEIVRYGDGIWHSIHPDFLATQVDMSLERMRLDMTDVYLLHNPEYYLEDQAHHKSVGDAERDEFYRRVREAFRYLEEQVAAGRIRWYGVSSNNFPAPIMAQTRTSVERCWEAAKSVSPNHHFRIIQLPLNLYESGAALEQNNGGKTVLEFAKEKGLAVLINRPLNAFYGNRMIRLADFLPVGQPPPGVDELRAILEPAWRMEQELEQKHGIPLLYGEGKGIAHYLGTIVPQVKSPAQWEQAFYEYVVMPIERWATECQQIYGDRPEGPEWAAWWDRFSKTLPAVLEDIGRFVGSSQQAISDDVRAKLEAADYPPTGESLSRIAANVLLSLDGVSCVLVGMRRPKYVEDAMGAATLKPVNSPAILSRFHEQVAPKHVGPIQ
jgi:aryl-alcohol dehydrogenase-like predicted oxidoreductase